MWRDKEESRVEKEEIQEKNVVAPPRTRDAGCGVSTKERVRGEMDVRIENVSSRILRGELFGCEVWV